MTQEVGSARTNPHWYREAIIYQAHVRAFLDSTSDGVGDFPGLTSKLGYLEGLGIDTLWLLPFYPSPLKDDGYDIADYENIHPAYGTLDDFDRFIEEAHRRQASASSPSSSSITRPISIPGSRRRGGRPAGSPARDFYVWSRHQPEVSGRADHLLGHREVELDLGRHRRRVLLAPILPPSAGSELRQPRGSRRGRAGHALLARSRRRRHAARCRALPDRARRHAVRQPRRDARRPQAHSRRDGRAARRPSAPRGGQPVAGGGQALLRRRRRVPHGVPLSADAADVHGGAAGGPAPDRRDPAPDAGHSRERASGGSSSATTTS